MTATVNTPGITTLLTVLFVGLKLTGAIAWSWWWVLSPLWIVAGLAVVVFAVLLAVVAISDEVKEWRWGK